MRLTFGFYESYSYKHDHRQFYSCIGMAITCLLTVIIFSILYVNTGKKYDSSADTLNASVQAGELHTDQKVHLDEYTVLCEFESVTYIREGTKSKICAVGIVDSKSQEIVYILPVETDLKSIKEASIRPPEAIGDSSLLLYQAPLEGFLTSNSSTTSQTMSDMRYLLTTQGMSQEEFAAKSLPYRLTDTKLGTHISESRESDTRTGTLVVIIACSFGLLIGLIGAYFYYKRLKTY